MYSPKIVLKVGLGIVGALGLVEGTMRLSSTSIADMLPNVPSLPALAELRATTRFVTSADLRTWAKTHHDPDLGWDLDQTERQRPSTPESGKTGRVVVVGDELAFGYGIATERAWPALLDNLLSRHRVLNMGVPGYGLDQSLKKFLLHGRQLQPNAVVIGATVTDYYRTVACFTLFAKPCPEADGENFKIKGRPVPDPIQLAGTMQNHFKANTYLGAWLFGRWEVAHEWLAGSQMRRMYEITDAYLKEEYRALLAVTAAEGTRVVVAHFHPPSALSDEGFLATSIRMKGIYKSAGVTWIDLPLAMAPAAEGSVLDGEIREGLTADGHRDAAAALGKQLRALLPYPVQDTALAH